MSVRIFSRPIAAAIVAGALCAAATAALAQGYPKRAITLMVPFAAGSEINSSARVQAQRLSELLGVPIVVENNGAAAGMAGSARVANAAPDGYTMLIGNSGTHVYSQSLYRTPLYNAITDFAPVGLVTESPRILLVRRDLPVRNLQEFIAYARRNQSKMQYGSAGVGSGTHLSLPAAVLFLGGLRIIVPDPLRFRRLAVPQTSWNLLHYALTPFRVNEFFVRLSPFQQLLSAVFRMSYRQWK